VIAGLAIWYHQTSAIEPADAAEGAGSSRAKLLPPRAACDRRVSTIACTRIVAPRQAPAWTGADGTDRHSIGHARPDAAERERASHRMYTLAVFPAVGRCDGADVRSP
jgi:hypothetical protein